MSISTKKQSLGKQQDRSDVLSLLLSIENMYLACQNVLNTYTQTTLMLSITIETQMLLMKLKVMKDRWSCHLPFKEACKVDFFDWGKKVKEMSQKLKGVDENGDSSETLTEYSPSKHFMLDLYEKLPESLSSNGNSAYYHETNISKLIGTQDKMLKQITKQWSDYKTKFSEMVVRELDGRISDVLLPLAEHGENIRLTCAEVLLQLSSELYQLHDFPKGAIQRDMFARLAERVISEPEYNGRKAQADARRSFVDFKNKTPDEEWERGREDEIRMSIEIIRDMKYGLRVQSYIGRDFNIKDNLPKLGKFLNSFRRDINEDELYELLKYLYYIFYLREDKEQEASKMATEDEPTSVHTAKDAQSMYERRLFIEPQRPRLPSYFMEKLSGNKKAVDKFYEIFHHCGFYIGRPLLSKEKHDELANCYEDWKWKHIREAFMELGFIRNDTPKKGFAVYLESVFPYLNADNVKRGFNNRSGYYEDETKSKNIINDIIAEFQPVKDLI